MNLKAIAGLFNLLPGWLYALALAGVLATLLGTTLELSSVRADLFSAQADLSDTVARMASASQRAEERYRAREADMARVFLEEVNDAHTKTQAAEAAAATARAAGQRLRGQLAALAAASCSPAGAAAAAGTGPTAEAARDLLADVQRRLDQAQDDIAGFADAASAAGATCERLYDRTRNALIAPGPME